MGVKTFQDLECWQLSNQLKAEVYPMLARPPLSLDRDFCSDIRRSLRSAPANISEGFGRFDHGEFGRYLSIALGSLHETENHLIHAHSEGILSPTDNKRLTELVHRAQKATNGLLKHVRSTPTPRIMKRAKRP